MHLQTVTLSEAKGLVYVIASQPEVGVAISAVVVEIASALRFSQ